MRYLLATDSELTAPLVSEAAVAGETLTLVCQDRNLVRRLRRRGYQVLQGALDSPNTWRRARLASSEVEDLVIISVARRITAHAITQTVHGLDADVPVLVLEAKEPEVDDEDSKKISALLADMTNTERIPLTDIVRAPFQEQFANAFVRRRVQRYRDHFRDADKVLILLHDEPDPDAIASALALRALLGRNRQTAIIGTFQAPTRPENLRMIELLGIHVNEITVEDLPSFDRIAVVDTQPHIFQGKVDHVDLVIDHHPQRSGYTATFKDIRTTFGATSTLLIDHMHRCGVTVSERLATAAVYAIKTDTGSFQRGTNAADVAIFAQLYPLADQAVLRRVEGEGFTIETLRLIGEVAQNFELVGRFIYSHLGEVPRDDYVPRTADMLVNLAESHWSAVSGVLEDTLTISVRNLGYQRSAGELVQTVYGDIASAGGHRAAAKAIIPLDAAIERFGPVDAEDFAARVFTPLAEAAGEG
ncbi:MAG: DHH family phosphoesterase [Acidobacteriota bacterium]